MKDAHLRICSLLAALIPLSFTAFGATLTESGNEFLADLHDFRINNYLALDAFYAFSATSDTELLNRVVVGIISANDAMNSVVGSNSGVFRRTGRGTEPVLRQLQGPDAQQHQQVRDRGYPDLRLMAELANQGQSMNDTATELSTSPGKAAELKPVRKWNRLAQRQY